MVFLHQTTVINVQLVGHIQDNVKYVILKKKIDINDLEIYK